jgi:hypothetical protein
MDNDSIDRNQATAMGALKCPDISYPTPHSSVLKNNTIEVYYQTSSQ